MKKVCIFLLLLCGMMSFASNNNGTNGGINLDKSCVEWGNWIKCSERAYSWVEASSKALLCQSANNGNANKVRLVWVHPPDAAPWSYYALYWRKCQRWKVTFPKLVAAVRDLAGQELQQGGLVSETFDDANGNSVIYLAERNMDLAHYTVWDQEGNLLEHRLIDPNTDATLIELLSQEEGITWFDLQP